MGVRPFLTLPIYARAPGLFHISGLAQTAVAFNRKNRNVAASVIRDQNKPAASIHIHITRIRAQRWFLIQQPQFARLLIDSKGADGSAFSARKLLDFVDGVQITPVECESEKRRINYAPRGAEAL